MAVNYTEHLTEVFFFESLYDITRFSISKQHLSLDEMCHMKDIKGHMTQKTTVVI